jgi:uncharacterized protein YecE (DUF72 family)
VASSFEGVQERFVFFNNDPGCAAVANAATMAAQARRAGIETSRTP